MIVGLLDHVDEVCGARKTNFRHDILEQWDAYATKWSKHRHRAILQVFDDLCDGLAATREYAHVHHWSSNALQLSLDAQLVCYADAALLLSISAHPTFCIY